MTFATPDTLNWGVNTLPLFAGAAGEDGIRVPGKVAQVRDDNGAVLGITSPSYEVFQNSSLRDLIMPHVEEGLLTITAMGYLGDGEKVYIQAQMADEYTIAGETHRARLTLLNSHNGTAALAAGVTDHRVICSNTFAMAMTDMSTRLRHNAAIHDGALGITEVLSYVDQNMRTFGEHSERLAIRGCNVEELDTVIRAAYGKEEAESVRGYNNIVRLFRSGRGNAGATMWDAVNAITEYTTHYAQKDNDKRFASSNFGRNAVVARRAYATALAMV